MLRSLRIEAGIHKSAAHSGKCFVSFAHFTHLATFIGQRRRKFGTQRRGFNPFKFGAGEDPLICWN
jgi:hypothetical protein